jgi:hypothetical protein
MDDLTDRLDQMAMFPDPADSDSPSSGKDNQPSSPNAKALRKHDKKEKNNRTIKAKQILETIKARISTSFDQLSDTPTHEILREIETSVGQMRSSAEKITRCTWSLEKAKRETFAELQRLEARVLELRILVPPPAEVPLTFSNGMLSLHPIVRFETEAAFTTDHHWNLPIDNLSPTAQVAILLGVVCSVIMGVSRNGGDIIMAFLSITLVTGFMAGRMNMHQERILSEIPLNITDALSKFNFEGKTTIYAVCPRCQFTYKPEVKRGSSRVTYPEFCTNKPNPDSDICNEALLASQSDGTPPKPLKTFVYHSFHDYLGGLLARKDLEVMMDKACDDLKESAKGPGPDIITGAFEAEFLRSFEWKDGTMFVDRKGVEGRFAFTLNIDFFSVEGNRRGGARASAGIISMACLNLPLEIRYNPENMFLAGIIPGPEEPHLTELNHYVRPVIDDMEMSWERGVRYSRTALYPMGRMTHCAIAAVVSDLPAARAAAQFAGHRSHHLCSVCNCFHKDNIHRTDWQNWTTRDNDEVRKQAEMWRDAPSLKEQNRLFDTYGVRYSEFWRLPYWNPARQLVVDVMHCILLGVTHHYFRDALGLTEQPPHNPISRPAYFFPFRMPHPSDKTHGLNRDAVDDVYLIHDMLRKGIEDKEESWANLSRKLALKNKKAIQYVVDDLKLKFPPRDTDRVTRARLADLLVNWVSVTF